VRNGGCNRRRTNESRSRKLDASKNRMGRSRPPGGLDQQDSIGLPFERPRRYRNRKLLTEEEYAERARENHTISSSVQAGVNSHAGYWAQHEGVEA
jgi:hypothetical protein